MEIENTYLPDHAYGALVQALTTLTPCPVSGKIESYQIIEALGEIGGVWPASIQEVSFRDSGPAAEGETLLAAA